MYSSPFRSAVVATAPASEPAPGSVRANAPNLPSSMGQKCCFCCSRLPAIKSGYDPRLLAPKPVAIPTSP